MSKIRRLVVALLVLSVLAFRGVSQAEPPAKEGQPPVEGFVVAGSTDYFETAAAAAQPEINSKELQCLAQNIFHEAASEPLEGKVAVGLVTLNRTQDSRFARTICGVVNQRLVRRVIHAVEVQAQSTWFSRPQPHTEYRLAETTVCQFSWRCMFLARPKATDPRWVDSQRIATELLASTEAYSDYRDKYDGALYFHATSAHPSWRHDKAQVAQVGRQVYYRDRR